jgi:signal transduction histidine kinase
MASVKTTDGRFRARLRREDPGVHIPLLGPSVALGVLALIETLAWTAPAPALMQQRVAVAVVALAATLPLATTRPTRGAVTMAAANAFALVLLHRPTVSGAVALAVAGYRTGERASSTVVAALGAPFLVIGLLTPSGETTRVVALVVASLLPIAVCLGAARRERRELHDRWATDHAVADSLLEHKARGERVRVSRELHDVVAHHISMISVQAETARLTTPDLPELAAQRLTGIGDTARAALTEMRRLLGVLRADTATDDSPASPRRPEPGLGGLIELVDTARATTGSGARLVLRGTPATLDPGVELATYRIVQEALTNARRHAPGAAVDVELHYSDDRLHLQVRDNGLGPGPADSPDGSDGSSGHGLLGMRERSAAVGGDLEFGAIPGGGWVVCAAVPLPGAGPRARSARRADNLAPLPAVWPNGGEGHDRHTAETGR